MNHPLPDEPTTDIATRGAAAPPGPHRPAPDLRRLRAEVIGHKSVPAAPSTLARILRLADEDRGVRELVLVIERDPGLSGKILRMANSAFFGQARTVAAIPRAVLVLGVSLVRNLALSMTVWDAMARGVERARLESLWQHSALVGVATRLLAERTGACDSDQAFSAGLLHDTGRLVLARRFAGAYWSAVEAALEGTGVEQVERQAFGVDHATVGGWLFESWHLPPAIVRAVQQHHDPDPAAGLPALVATTSLLAHRADLRSAAAAAGADADADAAAAAGATAEHPFPAQAVARGVTPELWAEVVAAVEAEGTLRQLRAGD